jgi:hypothetical protein
MTSTPSGKTVGLAAPWPPLLAFIAIALCAAATGAQGIVELLREGGAFTMLLLPMAVAMAVVAGVFATVGLPRVVALLAALVPWIAGTLIQVFNDARVISAIASVSYVDKPTMLAEGTAEALGSRIIGATFTAGIALGVTISQAVRARRDGPVAFAGAGAAFALFGAALGSA